MASPTTVQSTATVLPARPFRRQRIKLALPTGSLGILGTRRTGGLTWLLDKQTPSEALAVVLRQALASDVDCKSLP